MKNHPSINQRLSSSKPILGGGVAGSKYIIKTQVYNKPDSKDQHYSKMSPMTAEDSKKHIKNH